MNMFSALKGKGIRESEYDQPEFHLVRYGDVTKRQLDEFERTNKITLKSHPNPKVREIHDASNH